MRVADFNICQFWSSLESKVTTFFTTPVLTSLTRLKQKLLYNVVADRPNVNRIFVTLTVENQFYDQVFKEKSGSGHMRSFLNALRTEFHRHRYNLDYAWRLERGKKRSKRLHFHLIFEGNFTCSYLQDWITDHWIWCQWDKLDLKKSFQVLSLRNMAAMYVAKYASKDGTFHVPEVNDSGQFVYDEQGKLVYGFEEMDSPSQTQFDVKGNERKSRLWSTSRGFKCLPEGYHMVYNWDVNIWEFKMKANYRSGVNGPVCFAPYGKICIATARHIQPHEFQEWLSDVQFRNPEFRHPKELPEFQELLEQAKQLWSIFQYDWDGSVWARQEYTEIIQKNGQFELVNKTKYEYQQPLKVATFCTRSTSRTGTSTSSSL